MAIDTNSPEYAEAMASIMSAQCFRWRAEAYRRRGRQEDAAEYDELCRKAEANAAAYLDLIGR